MGVGDSFDGVLHYTTCMTIDGLWLRGSVDDRSSLTVTCRDYQSKLFNIPGCCD